MTFPTIYYKLTACINSCKNETHVDKCEVMINRLQPRLAKELAEMALLKRIELLTTIYIPEA